MEHNGKYVVMLMASPNKDLVTPNICMRTVVDSGTFEPAVFATYNEAAKHKEMLKSAYPQSWYAIGRVNLKE